LCLVLLAALGVFHDTLAAWVTDINTNDGLVDPNWGAPMFSASSPITNDDLDIKQAWMRNNDSNLFFHIETWVAPAVPAGFAAVAVLDCNSNGSDTDSVDRKIVYNPNTQEYLEIYDGSNIWMGTICNSDANCDEGERVSSSNGHLEWKYPYSTDPNFPTDCKNDIKIAWATVNAANKVAYMVTPYFGYDVPTTIELEKLQAVSGSQLSKPLLALLGISLVFGVSGIILMLRNKGKKSSESN
jgi:hypothetical protein